MPDDIRLTEYQNKFISLVKKNILEGYPLSKLRLINNELFATVVDDVVNEFKLEFEDYYIYLSILCYTNVGLQIHITFKTELPAAEHAIEVINQNRQELKGILDFLIEYLVDIHKFIERDNIYYDNLITKFIF